MKILLLTVLFFLYSVAVSASCIDPNVPFDCPADEVYYKCSPEVCYTTCEHLKNPPACAALSSDCYKPACLCRDGKFRNKAGHCVSESECD